MYFSDCAETKEMASITGDNEALAIRRLFSYDAITNTKFSNCTLFFKIGAVRQQNMQSKHQNTF